MKSRHRAILALTLLIILSKTGAATLTVTSIADNGPGTLRDALASASDGDTIDATGATGTILLTSGELLVNKSVSVLGPGPAKLAVDGNASGRVFHIDFGTTVGLSGLMITNGLVADDFGAGIYNFYGTLTVSNCVVVGNTGSDGGGIASQGSYGSASLKVVDTVLAGNTAIYNGGGIYSYFNDSSNSLVTVLHSVINGNQAAFGGGVLISATTSGVSLAFVGCSISSNLASSGGGIGNGAVGAATPVTFIVSNCVINGNIATGSISGSGSSCGGGIATGAEDGVMTIVDTTLSGNVASDFGGGIYNSILGNPDPYSVFEGRSTLQINNSTLTGNSARVGAGIASQGPVGGNGKGLLAISNTTISSNLADVVGGAIYNEGSDFGSSTSIVANCTLDGNSAASCGGIYNIGLGNSGCVLLIGSSILNSGTSGLNISNDFGVVTSLGYNLSSDDGGGVLTNGTDRINTDPLLGPLQDNGGPTFTCALLPGSPAIDQGKNFSGVLFDQRGPGFVRTFDDPSILNAPGGDGTDIGAFEAQPAGQNPAQLVQNLLVLVESQAKRPQPLRATLNAALASINRNNPTAAINQLEAFQNQVRTQVIPSQPVLAAALLQAAQDAINALNAAQR